MEFVTNLSDKRISEKAQPVKNIKWGNIRLFAIIFLVAVIMSEMARKDDWPNRRPLNLFENNYRFGSLGLGGGQALIPMMYEQYVERPKSPVVIRKNLNKKGIVISIERNYFYTGAGMVRAIPDPYFSIKASFIGGTAMKDKGTTPANTGLLNWIYCYFFTECIIGAFLLSHLATTCNVM